MIIDGVHSKIVLI